MIVLFQPAEQLQSGVIEKIVSAVENSYPELSSVQLDSLSDYLTGSGLDDLQRGQTVSYLLPGYDERLCIVPRDGMSFISIQHQDQGKSAPLYQHDFEVYLGTLLRENGHS